MGLLSDHPKHKSLHIFGALFLVVLCSVIAVWDLNQELGRAIWVLQFPLIISSLLLPLSWLPLLLTGLASVGVAIGYFYSPAGLDADIVILNRTLSILALLVIGGVAHYSKKLQLRMAEQSWIKRNQSDLSDLMKAQLKIEGLGQTILSYMDRNLHALAGAFYICEDKHSLRRAATLGTDHKEGSLAERISFGHGLVGKAAAQRQTVVLHDLKQDYFYIQSSLGKMKPRHLVIQPLVYDERTWGAVELAFAEAPTANQLAFLDIFSEGGGLNIRSLMDAERLQQLLEESQAQAEELQAQQEELRVSNEELEQQTKALEQSQAQLEEQQAELESYNQQLMDQRNALVEANRRLRDIQDDLRNKSEELEQANQYKSEFLANMSHELRTPLNSILILSRLLSENKQGTLKPDQVEYAQTIEASGNDLLNLINDILDLSKIEAGKVETHIEPIELSATLEQVRRQFEAMAKEKNLALELELSSDLPATIESDGQLLHQVVRNFVSNALKFTEKGKVGVRVHRPETEAQKSAVTGASLVISVTDTGIGIAPEKLNVIFEAFRQADGTTMRKYGGTGLGLSISKSLAHLLGGEVLVESELGKGSAFQLVIPELHTPQSQTGIEDTRSDPAPIVASTPAPATSKQVEVVAEPAKAANQPRVDVSDDRSHYRTGEKSVLVIEDDPKFASVICEITRTRGFKCLIASDGEEGCKMAEEYLPSAILLDIKLPHRSGLSVLEHLKNNPHTRHIPVHCMSGLDYSRNALQLGAVGYLVKPAPADRLHEMFDRVEQILEQDLKRVLVVEDNDLQRKMICELIGDRNVEVTAAESAGTALRAFEENSFDCIVMDLRLPDMSGFDLLEKIATLSEGHRPPVIIYTGKDLSRSEEEELRRYSESIIIKGAKSPERLLDETTLFLHRVETDLNDERQKMLKKLRQREKTFEDRKILVVDDDMRNVFALSSVLEDKGMQVKIGRNGREALEKLQEDSDVDLVLMDIMMPEMDGLEAIRRIRKDKNWQQLPIIALTAKTMKGDQERCLEAGASDYMSKPVNTDQLLSLMRVWLHSGERWTWH